MRYDRDPDAVGVARAFGAALMIVMLAVIAPGCTDDTDPPWQLDHQRIIAVRATPPRILAGAEAVIDGLIGFAGAPTIERAPDEVVATSPASLASAVRFDAGRWVVRAPDSLAGARSELGLAADAPVPLVIEARYAATGLRATKTVWLGATADNPTMAAIQINGAAPGDDLVIAPLVDVPMAVAFDDEGYDVTWLSSCGTMHDFDLPKAYLRVEADDPTAGQLAVVVRDATGGVSWRLWTIRAEP